MKCIYTHIIKLCSNEVGSFFEAVYFFLFIKIMENFIRRGRGDYEYGAEVTRGRPD